jgi:hypothetical protein
MQKLRDTEEVETVLVLDKPAPPGAGGGLLPS